MNPIILAIVITMTSTLILSLFSIMFLFLMHLRIKSELSETVKIEIEKNRDIYEFVKRRRFVNPGNIVVDFQKIHPNDPEYKQALSTCKSELKERSSGRYKTLAKIGNLFELSEDSKKFFIYESPSVKELMKYVFRRKVEVESFL